MLPYLAPPKLVIGGATLYLFGFLVGAGGTIGVQLALKRARVVGLRVDTMGWLLFWVTVGGFVGAHVLDLLVYEPRSVLADPMKLLRIWESLGSFGGFAGSTLAAFAYFWLAKVKRRMELADAVAWAFPVAWAFGRLGCAFAYDHVGRPTTFFLGQRYSDGVVRHNLGLDEAIFTVALAIAFQVLGRKPRRPGFFVGTMMLAYAPFRFLLDVLRAEDTRYHGFTPAQLGAVIMGLSGAAFLARRPPVPAPASEPLV